MKKTIFAVFAVVLCLCALCAVVVSAENAPETDIVAHNLALNDSVNIVYYADFQNVPENAEKGILIWTSAQDEYIYGSENAKLTTVRGISAGYTTYAFTGVSAKMMSQDIYAKSYIKVGDDITYGPLDKYSVLQYCYNKKGSTSTAGGGTKTLGELVEKMLEYGAFAQEYFNYNTDRMADATYYTVDVVNGTLPDGTTSGLYPAGKKLTLVADIPDGETFAYWQNADGESVGNNENLTITVGVGNQTYTAVYGIVAPVDEHNYGEWIAEVPATCTENGTKGHYLCSHCGEYFDETFNIIDDLTILSTGEHNYGEWQTLSAPTCVNSGIEARQCANCGVYDRRNLPALGHDYGEWIINKEATCTANGERVRACSRCGIYQRETLYSPGHQFGNWVTVKEATCEKGFEERTCSVCGKVERNWLPADYTSHIWGDETCTVCGEHKASEGLQYEMVNGNEIAIWGYTGSDTTVYLPSSYIGCVVTTIRAEAFKNQAQITEIVIPESIKTIENDAFNGCSHLKNLQIQNPSVSIWSGAFSGCISLENVTIPTYAISAISKDKLKTVVLTGGTSIGYRAFYNCSSLTSIEITSSVTSIGDYAFYYCSKLTSIDIPEGVTSIGERAFDGCSSLTSVNITDIAKWCEISFGNNTANPLYYAHNLYLNGELVTELIIPEGVTSIGDYAFDGCSSLTSIEIPEGVTSIGYEAFYGCSSLTSVNITDIAKWCEISFGGYYANPLYYAHNLYLNGELVTELIIPEGITSIGNYAFHNCRSLTSIEIPEGVTSIGNYAFRGCSYLTSIEIPEGVTSIGYAAFAGCSSLTSIEIPEGVTSIGGYAFDGCSALTSIDIPEGVTSIGDGAFRDCSSLTSINIPESVTSIGYSAFAYCSALTSITVAEGNTVYHSAGNCIIETASKTLIAGYKNSVIPTDGSVTSIGYAAFGCSSLTSIEIPASVTSIGERAFWFCSALTSINYTGTKAQWSAISKGGYWNYNTGNYTVYCTDGNIAK